MTVDTPDTPIDRRALLTAIGGLGAALAVGAHYSPIRAIAGQTGATPAAAWTPPPIPLPLPTPGGTPPPVTGAAIASETIPSAGVPATTENPQGTPQAGASPEATPMASPVADASPAASVTLTADFQFDPAEVTIGVGQSVTWVNQGRSPQTVTCDVTLAQNKSRPTVPGGAQPWNSGVLNYGDDFVQTFDVAGEYTYFSIPREADGMIGRVIVQ